MSTALKCFSTTTIQLRNIIPMIFHLVSIYLFIYLFLTQAKVHELQDQNHSLGQEINLLRSMVSHT